VRFQVLLKENFKVEAESSWSDSAFSRTWKVINNAIKTLRKQVAERKGIKKEDVEKKITRKEAIEYYFDYKDGQTFKFGGKVDEEIDKKMLDIICGEYKKLNFLES
jgi:hypothetical protein